MISYLKKSVLRVSILEALIPVLMVLLFVPIIIYLRAFNPAEVGFEKTGSSLLIYHACRLMLVFYIIVLSYVAGYRILEWFHVNLHGLFDGARKTFILCFFFGASLYGVVFTALGLAGMIGLPAGLALTMPVLLFCYRPLKALIGQFCEVEARILFHDTKLNVFFMWFVIMIAAYAAIIFLLTRTVFVAVFDPNIWEHYVHYYRAVLASGSTQPNEVWHHFYASKGAGLIFLANVLSDFFGAQIVSACFVLVAAVIILDLLLEYSKSTTWAFFGVMLFLTFMYGHVDDGATFKHHAVILGYMSFTLWGCVRLRQATLAQVRPLMLVLIVSLVYFSFYQPAVIVLLLPALLLLVLINIVFHSKTHLRIFLFLACASFAGSALAFGTNWILTGLLEVTPMRWLWAIADREKVAAVFGTGGVEFFLGRNNDLAVAYDWSFQRIWKILQYPLPMALLYFGLLGIVFALIRKNTRGSVENVGRFLLILAAFILPLSIFAQVMQTAAVDRVALYSLVYMTLATVLAWKVIVDVCEDRCNSITIKFSNANLEFSAWRTVSMMIIVLGMSLALMSAWKDIGKIQRRIIYGYVLGKTSLKDSMYAIETLRLNNTGIGINVDKMSSFLKTTHPDGRILRLAYDFGFSYALPGDGIISEPTYSLVRNPSELLAAGPAEVVNYLRERNVNYFTVSLNSKLFSTIAFTSLFDVREMPKYLTLAYGNEDFYILTWRQDNQKSTLTEYFLTLFELKRTEILHYPFTKHFGKLLISDRVGLVKSVDEFEKVQAEFLEDIDKVFDAEMMPRVSLGASKALLYRILEAGKDAVRNARPGQKSGQGATSWIPPNLWNILNSAEDSRDPIFYEIQVRALRENFLTIFREAIFETYEFEVGNINASLFRAGEGRGPFATVSPPFEP